MKLTEVYSTSGGFLKASDITQPTSATIESYEVFTKDYGDGKGEKSQVILSFVGKEKRLGLNWGNAHDIEKLIGTDDVDQWIGTTIKMYVKNEKIGNEMKDVIRIWPELPEQVTPTAPKPSDNTPAFSGTVVEDTEIPF